MAHANNMERGVGTVAPPPTLRKATWCSRRSGSGGCSPAIDLSPPPDRPDPSIYSQAPLIAAGQAATWDNPDIVVYATPQHTGGSWRIDPAWFLANTLVTVRNKSGTAAAINTVVAVSYAQVGIGMPRTPLSTQLVSLAAGEARQLSIPLPSTVFNQPEKAIAIFVDVSHPYDVDPANNHGANTSIITLAGGGVSGANPISLGNATAAPISYVLSVEPNPVGATLSATQVTVPPGATRVVNASFGGRPSGTASFTVVARDAQGNLAGGFTSLLYFG